MENRSQRQCCTKKTSLIALVANAVAACGKLTERWWKIEKVRPDPEMDNVRFKVKVVTYPCIDQKVQILLWRKQFFSS